jgi:hypothetical protein
MLADAVKEGMDGVSITPWYRNAERAGARPIDQIELTHDTDRSNQPTTQLTVRGHNFSNDIGLFPRHDRLTDDDMERLHNAFGKQTTKRILEAMQGSNKKRSDVVMTALDEEDPFMYSSSGNGHVIDGHRYYYRDYLPRVLEKEARQIDPNIKAQGLFRLSDSKGRFGNKMGTHYGVAFSKKFIKAAKAGGFRSFKQGGEVEDNMENDSNIVNLAPAREEKKLKTFHSSLMDNVQNRASILSEAAQKLHDMGAFEGFSPGDRFLNSSGVPMKIERLFARKYNPNDRLMSKVFAKHNVKPTLVEHEGSHYFPMATTQTGVEGEDAGDWSRGDSYIDLMRQFGYKKMGGPRMVRATGGRIPEVDKLFKTAKKELDNSTKPMLNMHDDVIVNALRIAQGRV